MKLNYKIFKALNNPTDVQDTGGKIVEIYSMNQTNYLAKYAGKGQFAVWSSDSKTYKLLIEDGYYKTMKDLYSKRINQIWINFYEKADKIRYGLMFKMVFPMIGISMLIAILFSLVEALMPYQNAGLIGILAVVLVTNMIQTSMMRKRIEFARSEAIAEIKRIVGEERFNQLLQDQAAYFDTYFKFEDKEAIVEQAVEVIENNKEENKDK
jgi:hypothetical protein